MPSGPDYLAIFNALSAFGRNPRGPQQWPDSIEPGGPLDSRSINSLLVPRGVTPPGGFDYSANLPVQRMLQALPNTPALNPVINALLALHPQIDAYAWSPTPWAKPNWGIEGSIGWRW